MFEFRNYIVLSLSLLAVRICEPRTGTSGAEKLWSRCVGGHQVSSNGLLYYIMDNFFSFFVLWILYLLNMITFVCIHTIIHFPRYSCELCEHQCVIDNNTWKNLIWNLKLLKWNISVTANLFSALFLNI